MRTRLRYVAAGVTNSKPMRIRTLVLVLAAVLVMSLAGCTAKDDPVVLPEDPLCGLFPDDLVASMIPSGTYTKGTAGIPLHYNAEAVIASGRCIVGNGTGYFGVLASYTVHFSDVFSSGLLLYDKCDDMAVDLTAPRIGQIVSSGACVREEAGTLHIAWALYWGGRYGSEGPACANISVSIVSRKGRDGIADATQILQMVLDFIDQSYAADPSAASTETTAPGATPVPSSTPS